MSAKQYPPGSRLPCGLTPKKRLHRFLMLTLIALVAVRQQPNSNHAFKPSSFLHLAAIPMLAYRHSQITVQTNSKGRP